MVPSVEVMVAPTRFISGQNCDTEKRRWMAPRPPNTKVPTTTVVRALKWYRGSGVHTTSSSLRRQQIPIWWASVPCNCGSTCILWKVRWCLPCR